MNMSTRSFIAVLLLSALASIILIGCSATPSLTASVPPEKSATANACPVSKPIWIKPPDDTAIDNPPQLGYYFVNQDSSIWASAWWATEKEPTIFNQKATSISRSLFD